MLGLYDRAFDYTLEGKDEEAIEIIEEILDDVEDVDIFRETLEGVRHELTKTGDIDYALLLIHRAIGS